jgi:hypothetical protein
MGAQNNWFIGHSPDEVRRVIAKLRADAAEAEAYLNSRGHANTVDGYSASGGSRSEVKPFYSAIPAMSLRRLALRATGAPKGEARIDDVTGFSYAGGSLGYGYGNWAKGLPLRDTFNHIIEHLYFWLDSIEQGKPTIDDDLAAAAWGIMFPLMTFENDYISGGRPTAKEQK